MTPLKTIQCANLGDFIGVAHALLDWPLFECKKGEGCSLVGKTTDGKYYCRVDGNPEEQRSCSGFVEREKK